MEDPIFELMLVEHQKLEMERVLKCNEKTEKFGLVLSQEDANNLMLSRKTSLVDSQRVELGESILPQIIYTFCDSQYINQENYSEILVELQEIFYSYKNETMDELTDSELLDFMKKQYEGICFGDLDYLRSTCLERFAKDIRSGANSKMQSRLKDEYALRDIDGDYIGSSEETRWDYEVYKMKLEDLF